MSHLKKQTKKPPFRVVFFVNHSSTANSVDRITSG